MPAKITGAAPAAQGAPTSHGKLPAFLKTGAKVHEAIAKEDARIQAARDSYGKLWRFFITTKDLQKDFKITFLDGSIDGEGMLVNPLWKEHSYTGPNNRPVFYMCTDHGEEGSEPCPMCAEANANPNSKDGKASVVMGFTVLDWTPYTYEKGEKAGQTVPYQKRLYIAKRKTITKLQKFATKHGGLRGLTFQITRSSDMEANVGDMFMLDEVYAPEELDAMGDDAAPADWEKELTYHTAEELAKLGIGTPIKKFNQSEPSKDYTKEM